MSCIWFFYLITNTCTRVQMLPTSNKKKGKHEHTSLLCWLKESTTTIYHPNRSCTYSIYWFISLFRLVTESMGENHFEIIRQKAKFKYTNTNNRPCTLGVEFTAICNSVASAVQQYKTSNAIMKWMKWRGLASLNFGEKRLGRLCGPLSVGELS